MYDSRKDWMFDTCFAVLCVAGGFAAVLSSCAKVLLAKDMLLHAVKHESMDELVALEELHGEDSNSCVTEEKEEGVVLTATEESPEFQHRYDVGLAQANRTFSFIDLSMAVIAPILVGLICDSVFWKKDSGALNVLSSSDFNGNNGNNAEMKLLMNTLWAAVFVGAWNIVSCVPETLVPGRVATKHQLTELFQPQNTESAGEQDNETPSTGRKRQSSHRSVICSSKSRFLHCLPSRCSGAQSFRLPRRLLLHISLERGTSRRFLSLFLLLCRRSLARLVSQCRLFLCSAGGHLSLLPCSALASSCFCSLCVWSALASTLAQTTMDPSPFLLHRQPQHQHRCHPRCQQDLRCCMQQWGQWHSAALGCGWATMPCSSSSRRLFRSTRCAR